MDLTTELSTDEGWTKEKLERLQAAAISGHFRGAPGQRGVAWRLLLNILPQQSSGGGQRKCWKEMVAAQRDQYKDFKDKFDVTFEKATEHAADPLSSLCMTKRPDDDGAAGHENAWLQWDKANELKDEIKKDLNRLYPSGCDEHHFTRPVIQKLMCDVLFVWSCLHKATSYRQGMHEVLAVILYALQQEVGSLGADHPYSYLTDPAFLEHDVFVIFEKVMMELEPLYFYQKAKGSTDEAPLIRLCNRVQGELLKKADPEVYRNLEQLGVTPQLYGIKWFRLLFSREFVMEDVLLLWDYIFSYRHRIQASSASDLQTSIEVIAVSMMTSNRAELLLDDQSIVLRRLMSYNSAVAVSTVISQAEGLRRRGHTSPPLVGRLYPSLAPFSSASSDATAAQKEPAGKGAGKAGGVGVGEGPGATHVSLSGATGSSSSSSSSSSSKDVPYWLKGFGGGSSSIASPSSPDTSRRGSARHGSSAAPAHSTGPTDNYAAVVSSPPRSTSPALPPPADLQAGSRAKETTASVVRSVAAMASDLVDRTSQSLSGYDFNNLLRGRSPSVTAALASPVPSDTLGSATVSAADAPTKPSIDMERLGGMLAEATGIWKEFLASSDGGEDREALRVKAEAALAQVEHVRDALLPRQQSSNRYAAPWLSEGSEGIRPSRSTPTSRAAEHLPPGPPIAPPLTTRSALSSLFDTGPPASEEAGGAMGVGDVLSPALLAPRIIPQGQRDTAEEAGDPSWLFHPVAAQAPEHTSVGEQRRIYPDYKDGGLAVLPLQSGSIAVGEQTEPGRGIDTAGKGLSSLFGDEEQDDSWLTPVEV